MIARFFGGRECFFVQVGSNDGVRGDPLHDLILANPRWRGIFIEPMDELFARLLKTYEHQDRFSFEHLAISDAPGDCPFYYVSAETIRAARLPDWYDQIGSLSRDHVLKHLSFAHVDDPIALVSERQVRGDTLMSVLDRHRVERIDVLHIDVEGYDHAVLKQLDFARYRPKLILYEHRHLDEADRTATSSLLWRHGYRLIDCGLFDTMAVKRS